MRSSVYTSTEIDCHLSQTRSNKQHKNPKKKVRTKSGKDGVIASHAQDCDGDFFEVEYSEGQLENEIRKKSSLVLAGSPSGGANIPVTPTGTRNEVQFCDAEHNMKDILEALPVNFSPSPNISTVLSEEHFIDADTLATKTPLDPELGTCSPLPTPEGFYNLSPEVATKKTSVEVEMKNSEGGSTVKGVSVSFLKHKS